MKLKLIPYILLIGVFVCFFSCEKDTLQPTVPTSQIEEVLSEDGLLSPTSSVVKPEELLSLKKVLLKEFKTLNANRSNKLITYDSINFDNVQKLISSDSTRSTFTMFVNSNISPRIFHNIIIQSTDSTLSAPIVFESEIDSAYYEDYYITGNHDQEMFVGELRQMNLHNLLTTTRDLDPKYCIQIVFGNPLGEIPTPDKIGGFGRPGNIVGTLHGLFFNDFHVNNSFVDDLTIFDCNESWVYTIEVDPETGLHRITLTCGPPLVTITGNGENDSSLNRDPSHPDFDECWRIIQEFIIIKPNDNGSSSSGGKPDNTTRDEMIEIFAEELGITDEDVIDCMKENSKGSMSAENILKNDLLFDPCDPSKTANSILNAAITFACQENGSMTLNDLQEGLNQANYVLVENFDKSEKLDCIFNKIRNFGVCGEIINDFQENNLNEFHLKLRFDHNKISPQIVYGDNGEFIESVDHPEGTQDNLASTRSSAKFHEVTNELEWFGTTTIYNGHIPSELDELEIVGLIIHETLHAQFAKWIADVDQSLPENESWRTWSVTNPLWKAVVEEKYGVDTELNQHKLMLYFRDRIARDLWEYNGDTDESNIEKYYWYVYDLLSPDPLLISENFLNATEMQNYKDLAELVTVVEDCE